MRSWPGFAIGEDGRVRPPLLWEGHRDPCVAMVPLTSIFTLMMALMAPLAPARAMEPLQRSQSRDPAVVPSVTEAELSGEQAYFSSLSGRLTPAVSGTHRAVPAEKGQPPEGYALVDLDL